MTLHTKFAGDRRSTLLSSYNFLFAEGLNPVVHSVSSYKRDLMISVTFLLLGRCIEQEPKVFLFDNLNFNSIRDDSVIMKF